MNYSEALQELYGEETYNIPGKLLVIIRQNWDELNNTDIQLLNKILAAIKITLAQVQVVSAQKIGDIPIGIYNPSAILLFGLSDDPTILPYQVITYKGIPALSADALYSLDEPNKKKLWLALKTMFAA